MTCCVKVSYSYKTIQQHPESKMKTHTTTPASYFLTSICCESGAQTSARECAGGDVIPGLLVGDVTGESSMLQSSASSQCARSHDTDFTADRQTSRLLLLLLLLATTTTTTMMMMMMMETSL